MNKSESIAKLALALSKAQGEMKGALKDSSNPFFKSKYADLESCWDSCRSILAKNELSVIQTFDYGEGGDSLTTVLAHSSGEWISGKQRLLFKDATAQGLGAASTYARRFGLAAIVGIVQVDDDGNEVSGRPVQQQRPAQAPQQRPQFK